ncbi:hypothetical protein JW992_06530 [candidate division KSB1 bacterium]|nr:hypothetical protein [candidate division KSB1 bacterium]
MSELNFIRTGRQEIDQLLPTIASFLKQDYLDVVIDSQKIRGYRSPDAKSIWIRDHSDMMRGFRYFETDMTSAVQHFADTQARSGRIFDYVTIFPEKLPSERENWTKYVRVPVEADVEYRFVKAAYLAWQTTGDDEWIRHLLPSMDRALNYIRSHPWRWDSIHQLVKRAYTIDSWDFAYSGGTHDWLQFQIDENTFWGLMHGDNSGYYQAFRIMETLYRRFADNERADYWRVEAEGLKERMNRICWNGRFYTHFVKLNPVTIPGVDEAAQLSFSNPIDINRGVANHEMAVSILREYQARKKQSGAFTDWFSIDPAFPDGVFGDELLKAGAYCNGGIMPLVGGELARAGFEHGFETYGVETLLQYSRLVAEKNETFLWYFPDGTASSIETSTSPDATPTDGWGSSSMLYALMEGLVGIEDRGKKFDRVRFAPRWPAANVNNAVIQIGYPSSGAKIGYDYRQSDLCIEIDLKTAKTAAECHILLPADRRAERVSVSGETVDFKTTRIEQSHYVDFICSVSKTTRIVIDLSSC